MNGFSFHIEPPRKSTGKGGFVEEKYSASINMLYFIITPKSINS